MILYQFQVSSFMVRKSNALQSALLAPYKVTTVSLTVSPGPYATSCVYYVTTRLSFLITSSFSPYYILPDGTQFPLVLLLVVLTLIKVVSSGPSF